MVWSDNLDTIIPLCTDFEEKLIKLVWRYRRTIGSSSFITSTSTSTAPSTTASNVNLNEKSKHVDVIDVSEALVEEETRNPKPAKTRSKWGWKLSKPTADSVDLEKGASKRTARPIRLLAPIYSGLGAALSVCTYFYPTLLFHPKHIFSFHGQRCISASPGVASRS